MKDTVSIVLSAGCSLPSKHVCYRAFTRPKNRPISDYLIVYGLLSPVIMARFWEFDAGNPIVPDSPTHFGGVFDPQLTITSGIDYLANVLKLQDFEPVLLPYVSAAVPGYFQGMVDT